MKIYLFGIFIFSRWNAKAKQWLAGRQNIFEDIEAKFLSNKSSIVWMHCASLGEFEQGRPLLESIKKEYPNYKILLSFFSPSGYEIRKNYTGADYIIYLPIDGEKNAKKLLDIINPKLVFWVKYEYWHYYLTEIEKRKIPLLLISGIFRKSQPFFKLYGNFWKKMLESFSHFFVQNEFSKDLLLKINIKDNVSIAGDTRYDRVWEIAQNFSHLPQLISNFCDGNKVIVAGSTWTEDEEQIIHFVKTNPKIKLIIAPHEIDKENIDDVKTKFVTSVLYSKAANDISHLENKNVLVIDNIGMLSLLYFYADICYIGGGFNESGIHNCLEAAVYGKPIIFGPQYEKFHEAVSLVNAGAAFSFTNPVELEKILSELFGDDSKLDVAGKAAKKNVETNKGATQKIMDYIYKNRLLTN